MHFWSKFQRFPIKYDVETHHNHRPFNPHMTHLNDLTHICRQCSPLDFPVLFLESLVNGLRDRWFHEINVSYHLRGEHIAQMVVELAPTQVLCHGNMSSLSLYRKLPNRRPSHSTRAHNIIIQNIFLKNGNLLMWESLQGQKNKILKKKTMS